MTNKEYIRWLKLLDEELTFDGLVDGKDEMDMHEMIFDLCEKLEQEPCEDCISREWLLKQPLDVSNYPSNYVRMAPSVKPKIDRLYSWLNDMRLGIAPDETTPQDERGDRLAQVDVIDDIMEWLDRQEG